MQEILDKIVNNMMDSYHNDMRDFLRDNHGKLMTDQVLILMLNIISNMSTNLYYSLKDYHYDAKIDYDFIKVKMINELSTAFENIKNYDSNREISELTEDQIREIFKNGHTMITLKNGKQRKITEKNLMLKKEDYDKYLESANDNPKTNH